MGIKQVRRIFLQALKKRLDRKRKIKKNKYGVMSSQQFMRTRWFSTTEKRIKLKVISVVTGEELNGVAFGTTRRKHQLWLDAHPNRTQVENVYLPKGSTFHAMSDTDWTNYPIVLVCGARKYAYVIDHCEKYNTGKRIVCNLFLASLANIPYLKAVGLAQKLIDNHPVISKIKIKPPKKRKKIQYWDRYGW
jgi:hypothetical protein